MRDLAYGPPGEEDVLPLAAVLSQCFHFPEEMSRRIVSRAGPQARVVRRGGEVVAGLLIHEMEQFFGGRGIRMGGIGAVGVAPHVRGGGVGAFLMGETVRELRARGVPLSTLYASTQRLYRSVGYEQAGTFLRFEAPTRSIPRLESDLPAWPVDPGDHEKLAAIADRGPKPNGWVRRDRLQWALLADPVKDRVFAYGVGPVEGPEGYVLLYQTGGADGYVVIVKDLVALTAGARTRLLRLLSDHRSLGRTCRFDAAATDPLLLLFAEQEYRVAIFDRFMLRITDVPAALAGRGYPAGLAAELDFEIDDQTVPENSGRFRLRVGAGEGTVEEGGEGRLRLGVRAIAPLFTGLCRATALADLDMLSGDTDSLESADRVFAGPEPFMSERF